jgi:hypothetical protein
VKYTLFIMLLIAFIITGCGKEDKQIAKETAAGTSKDISDSTTQGIEKLAEDVGYAAPDMQNDIVNAFWSTVDAIQILAEGESVKDIPTPADVRGLQIIEGIECGAVKTAKAVEEEKIIDATIAYARLATILQAEINSKSPDSSGAQPSTSPEPVEKPTPEEIHNAWITLSKLADTPEKTRQLFTYIMDSVTTIPDIKILGGIHGPVDKIRIGQKAQEFLATLKPGEVSRPVNFKNGILIVQMIEDTGTTIEAGFIFIPGKQVEKGESQE